MTYPKLCLANGEKAYGALDRSEDPDWPSLVADHEVHVRSYRGVAEAVDELLHESPDAPTTSDLRQFEAALGIRLHELIPWGEHTGDKSFWRWVAFVPLGEAVVYRHGEKGMPDKKNYGIGSLTENLAFRSWMRADIAYDATAPSFSPERYAWARVGDQDLWRSFLFRVRYSYSREMAKALLEFQHPDMISSRTLKPGDKDTGIRMLSKRLTRLHPNMCFAALGKSDCLDLLDELADGLELEGGGTYSSAGRN
jgi:hypothetical protein